MNCEVCLKRTNFKTHKLLLLLVVAGLKPAYDERKTHDRGFVKYKGLLEDWNEGARYWLPGTVKAADAQSFLDFLANPDGFLQWIEQN